MNELTDITPKMLSLGIESLRRASMSAEECIAGIERWRIASASSWRMDAAGNLVDLRTAPAFEVLPTGQTLADLGSFGPDHVHPPKLLEACAAEFGWSDPRLDEPSPGW